MLTSFEAQQPNMAQ